MEESMFLSKFASRVFVVHRRDAFRASQIMADRVLKNEKIEVCWDSVIDEILGNDEDGVTAVRIKNVKSGETKEIAAAGYFSAIGHKPASDLVKDLVELDDAGYVKTVPGTSKTKVEGLFCAGDVQDPVYRQAVTSAGSGCIAAIDATRWLESQE